MNKSITYLHLYFCTPSGKWSTRAYDFSKTWIENGYIVNVITSVYYKSDLTIGKGLYNLINIDGINVYKINVLLNNKDKKFKRIVDFLKIFLITLFLQIKLKSDYYIFSSGPITTQFNSILNSLIFRKRITVTEVRDLLPEVVEEISYVKNATSIKFLKYIVKINYLLSDKIITLSRGMSDYIVDYYGINSEKIIYITNSVDFEGLKHIDHGIDFYLPDNFLLYFGNLGEINLTDKLYELTKSYKLKYGNNLSFVFVGDGPLKDWLIHKKSFDKADNIYVIESLPKSKLSYVINNSIACFVSLYPGKILNTSSPNKLFESLAHGKPVIQTTNGWIKEEIDDFNLGITIDIDNYDISTKKINDFINCYHKKKYLVNCKEYALNNYNKNILANRMIDFIEK